MCHQSKGCLPRGASFQQVGRGDPLGSIGKSGCRKHPALLSLDEFSTLLVCQGGWKAGPCVLGTSMFSSVNWEALYTRRIRTKEKNNSRCLRL